MEGGITKRLHKITWGKKEGEHKKVVTGYNVKCEKTQKYPHFYHWKLNLFEIKLE